MSRLPFLVLVVQFITGKRAAQKQAESASRDSCDRHASFLLLLCSDNEQTWLTKQNYKTMVRRYDSTVRNDATKNDTRRTEHDGQCYETYERCPMTGGEPSLSRLPSDTPVEGGQQSLIRIFLPASISTRRRTEDEAGSPRVADRNGLAAVFSSSPRVLHVWYSTTGAKRQASCFLANGFCDIECAKRGM